MKKHKKIIIIISIILIIIVAVLCLTKGTYLLKNGSKSPLYFKEGDIIILREAYGQKVEMEIQKITLDKVITSQGEFEFNKEYEVNTTIGGMNHAGGGLLAYDDVSLTRVEFKKGLIFDK